MHIKGSDLFLLAVIDPPCRTYAGRPFTVLIINITFFSLVLDVLSCTSIGSPVPPVLPLSRQTRPSCGQTDGTSFR